jgi:hypothetical protein
MTWETITKFGLTVLTHCIGSPYVPRMSWRVQYVRWNFLRDTGGAHQIGYIIHYFLIYLFIYLFVSGVQSLLLSSWSNTDHILNITNSHFAPDRPSNLLFSVTTLCTPTLCTISLTLPSYFTASVSIKIPFLSLFWSWVESSLVLGCCPLSAATLVSHKDLCIEAATLLTYH